MAVAEPILANDQDTGQSELAQRLARTWKQPKGVWGWFCNTHHTDIGIRFMVTAFIFLLLGGVLAVLIRLQLIRPENSLIGPDLYNQVFTMHGSTMIFLFAVPMMFQGFGVYVVPLMCGARNIAFPRLNAFSYYLYVGGALVLWGGFLTNTGPDVGWFAYVPLSGPAYSPGHRADIWSQMITFTEVSALGVAICIATTILRHRAPGMTLNRMPIMLWEKLVISIAVIFAMPAVMVASGLLLLDRLVGTHFFNPAEGGDVSALPALVLVLRASRGLHHLSSWGRHCLHSCGMLLAAPHFWIHADCRFCRRYRIYRIQRLGASHVCHRFAAVKRKLFYGSESDDRDSHRNTIFLLGSDNMVRKVAASLTDALVFRLFLRFLDRWIVRRHVGFGPHRLAGPRYLLCGRTFSLCPDWRSSFSDVRRHLFLVSEDDRTDGQLNFGKMALLAFLHRLQHYIFHAALSGTARHAPPRLHLRPRYALAGFEHARVERCGFHDCRVAGLPGQRFS